MNTKLLRKVAKHITEEPRRLNMDVVAREVNKDDPWNAPCGTAACIAGWACIITGNTKVINFGGGWDLAMDLLKLDAAEAHRLFDSPIGLEGDGWPVKFGRRYDRAKTAKGRAKIAVERIEHFIKTKGRE